MVGKKSRVSGADFERRVRKDMTEKDWTVDKFNNNVEFDKDIKIGYGQKFTDKIFAKLIQAKNKWAGPNRPMMMGAGFPDFVAFKYIRRFVDKENIKGISHEVIGVECKVNGWLSQLERDKCLWLLKNNIFSRILIAEKTKVKNRIVIVYHDFETKYGEKK